MLKKERNFGLFTKLHPPSLLQPLLQYNKSWKKQPIKYISEQADNFKVQCYFSHLWLQNLVLWYDKCKIVHFWVRYFFTKMLDITRHPPPLFQSFPVFFKRVSPLNGNPKSHFCHITQQVQEHIKFFRTITSVSFLEIRDFYSSFWTNVKLTHARRMSTMKLLGIFNANVQLEEKYAV